MKYYLHENSPEEFVEGLKRYKNSNGRLPDTDTLFSRLLNDLNLNIYTHILLWID